MRPNTHRGSILLLAALLLAGLALLGLAAATDARLLQRMSAHARHHPALLADAESALRWGEAWLLGRPGEIRPIPCAPPCPAPQVIRPADHHGPRPEDAGSGWWNTHAWPDGWNPDTGLHQEERASQGRWLVEEAHRATSPSGEDQAWYRLLAWAESPTGVVVVESLLARPYGQASWSDPLPDPWPTTSFCTTVPDDLPCGRLAWRERR